MTREEFRDTAQPVLVTVDGQTGLAAPREFKTGSFGFAHSEKVWIVINGKPVYCQVGVNIIVIGSAAMSGG